MNLLYFPLWFFKGIYHFSRGPKPKWKTQESFLASRCRTRIKAIRASESLLSKPPSRKRGVQLGVSWACRKRRQVLGVVVKTVLGSHFGW